MTPPRDFIASLTFTALILAFHCEADLYHPPTDLSYVWLDEFTVRLTWKAPRVLPDNVFYLLRTGHSAFCSKFSNATVFLLSDDTESYPWTYNIWTVSNCNSCNSCNSNDSTPASITIKPLKRRAELVRDFKCLASVDQLSCSWLPVNPSLNLTLSYRMCDCLDEESIKSHKKCEQPYSQGGRPGCHLHIDPHNVADTCILIETEDGMSTFKAKPVVSPPTLTITEEKGYLRLDFTPPHIGNSSGKCWIYTVHYKQCDMSVERKSSTEPQIRVPYDRRCRYQFQSSVEPTRYCVPISSDLSDPVFYGTNEPPDMTLTVVAIAIPIILSLCVILSCYCFRRHSAIICPSIPDPSTIFKEMMMNGNKEHKPIAENLYTPVPEPFESCKVTLVSENSVLQQAS